MTTVAEDIVSVLSGIQTYPLAMPQDGTAVLPCVVYQCITTKQFRHMGGNGLVRPRYQLSIWAENYDECVATATEVKSRIDLNQDDFEMANKDNELDTVPDESGLYRIIIDFMILANK